jgi:SAM-dependent methyltransferase
MSQLNPNEDFTEQARLADVGRWFVNGFVKRIAGEIAPGARVLDAGAGESSYKRFFAHCDYKSVDLGVGDSNWDYSNLDYVAPLTDLPVEDNTFDAILCTQVLEHLERPLASLCELHRVLKPGGRIYLTAPMAHAEHQTPYDFFRFTSFGLRSLLARAGFGQVEIEPFGGMFTRWAYELPRALGVFPPARVNGRLRLAGLIALPLKAAAFACVRATQIALLDLERLDTQKNDPFGWAVIATKKQGVSVNNGTDVLPENRARTTMPQTDQLPFGKMVAP